MSQSLSKANFSPLVGTTFRVQVDGGSVLELELSHCDVLASSSGESALRDDPFTLLLRGPQDVPLAQRMHTFEHEQLGQFEMFIVPVGPGEYEAVFT